MGTPDFSVPALESLIANHEIVGVFTQPDRPKGRGKKMMAPPVKVCAEKHQIPVYQPDRIKTQENVQLLQELSPDVIIVIAYGQIISQAILDIPKYGCINVHASLLPVLRGASPINTAIVSGHKETGVTTMKMDAGLDTGDMLLKKAIKIPPDMSAGELHDQLMEIGVEVLNETLESIETLKGECQDDAISTYAPILKKEMARIDWNLSAQEIHNLIRGFNPWPVAYTEIDGNRIKVYRSEILNEENPGHKPGTVIELSKKGLIVQTGTGLINLLEIQTPGSKRMLSSQYAAGHEISPMTIL
jgi:methionyl-tRNA formyltransferase